jgi:hypothetical protein
MEYYSDMFFTISHDSSYIITNTDSHPLPAPMHECKLHAYCPYSLTLAHARKNVQAGRLIFLFNRM